MAGYRTLLQNKPNFTASVSQTGAVVFDNRTENEARPRLQRSGEVGRGRAGPREAVVWPTKQTKVVMVRSHTAGSIYAVEMTHGCLLA